MKKPSKRLLGRIISVALAVVFQVLWIIFAVFVLRNRFPFVDALIEIASIVAILWIVSKDINPAYKLAWTILILAVPVAGAVIYVMFGKSRLGKDMQEKLDESFQEASQYLVQDEEIRGKLENESKAAMRQSMYISEKAGFPVYQKTTTKYFKVGEELYSTLLDELKAAEHYIFMEYFIIDDGEMWQGILDILEMKARLGLDVRLIYDDWGCASTMPQEFQMALKGEAVWSFTVMFLQMWSVLSHDKINYGKYRPHEWHTQEFEDDGFVQPYGDTPLDHETVGESVYLNIINRAKEYVYIFTPYLITDNEVITALCLAAKSGIDVRIVTPGIPDKKLVFLLTRSYYETLLKAGVRIFEYKPGFLHAKSFVCDDKIATVGTINLDYRSLYLHFECGVWMYGSQAVMQIKEDALNILEECREVTLEDCQNKSAATRIGQSILRLFAPLL